MDIFKKYDGRSYQSIFEGWVLEIEDKLAKLDKVIEDHENKNKQIKYRGIGGTVGEFSKNDQGIEGGSKDE